MFSAQLKITIKLPYPCWMGGTAGGREFEGEIGGLGWWKESEDDAGI